MTQGCYCGIVLQKNDSAVFTAVMLVSEVIGFGIWGTIGDRDGYKRVIEYSNLFLIIGLFSLLMVKNLMGLYIAFGIISFAHAGEYLSDQNGPMIYFEQPAYAHPEQHE